MINSKRYRKVNNKEPKQGAVLYWMNRDRRVKDNWALIWAYILAKNENRKLKVIHIINPDEKLIYSNQHLPYRHYKFLIEGLKEVENKLNELNISFEVLIGNFEKIFDEYLQNNLIGILVTDFSPLKHHQRTLTKIASKVPFSVYEVDAHNIVPCWIASDKQEFGAYTIRPKIQKQLVEFLDNFPELFALRKDNLEKSEKINYDNLLDKLQYSNVEELDWIHGGEHNARSMLTEFIQKKLINYHDKRNDPSENVLSNLSPYLNFGFISAQRIALTLKQLNDHQKSVDAFLEEMIIRRELTDNFCFYNSNYDSFEGFPTWAKNTLNKHKKDKRSYVYTLEEFENAKTHDELWNAAQMEMVKRGKMHGYMRMYWAKKILEWSESPEKAYQFALYLNDKYELDGRDPNGFVGCAWSIGGVHDRPWFERPIFGKIRYMSYDGCKRKFDVKNYIEFCNNL